MVVRTCFVLGNLTVTLDENRHKIFYSCNGIDVLMPLLVKYTNSDLEIARKLEKAANPAETADAKKVEKLKAANKETEQTLVKVRKFRVYFWC